MKTKYKKGDFVILTDGNLYIIDEILKKMVKCIRYGECPEPSIDNTFNTKHIQINDIVCRQKNAFYCGIDKNTEDTESEFINSIIRITNEMNDLKLECVKLIDENSQLKDEKIIKISDEEILYIIMKIYELYKCYFISAPFIQPDGKIKIKEGDSAVIRKIIMDIEGIS